MKRCAQSLSVCVPGTKCINNCKFCVSRMHSSSYYKNQLDENLPCYDLYLEDFIKRMICAKENDANTMLITGEIEPLQNRHFLQVLSLINQYVMPQKGCSGFNWIEIQSSAVGLDSSYARFLRNTVGVSVFSLSLSSFIENIFNKARLLKAEQLTFRKLYTKGDNEQSRWIAQNKVDSIFFSDLHRYIKSKGKLIGKLPYGYDQYSVDGISVVIDEDCMNEACKETSKYFVLRPNCKIYNGWNTEEIIF